MTTADSLLFNLKLVPVISGGRVGWGSGCWCGCRNFGSSELFLGFADFCRDQAAVLLRPAQH